MTRDATAPGHEYSGLYGRLLEREEAAALSPGRVLPWTPERAGYDGTPQRLAALLAGQPVTVYAGGLPQWARDGLRVCVTALTYVRVEADDGIELVVGARLFAEEQGL